MRAFSSRLRWDLRQNSVTQLLEAKRAAGQTILDLTESNPTQAQFEYPTDEIRASFSDANILRYDPSPFGLWTAREAVAGYLNDGTAAERVVITTSTSEAYAYLFKLLTDPGDEILVPRPSYPLFEFLAGMELVHTVSYPLLYDGAWQIDFAGLEAAIGPRTRAIVLVNPNNPTGSFLHAGELRELLGLCHRHGLALISDEVFSEYVLGGDAEVVRSLRGVEGVLTFSLSGLSKTAGLPQMKLGWMVVSGPVEERTQALERLELIADTYLAVGTPVQVAAPGLLRAGARIREQISARTARNLKALRRRAESGSYLRVLEPEGGWYAVLQVPRVRSEEEWVLGLLDGCGVLVQPGYFYDFASEAYLVVSLLTAPDIFDTGVSRLFEFGASTE